MCASEGLREGGRGGKKRDREGGRMCAGERDV